MYSQVHKYSNTPKVIIPAVRILRFKLNKAFLPNRFFFMCGPQHFTKLKASAKLTEV